MESIVAARDRKMTTLPNKGRGSAPSGISIGMVCQTIASAGRALSFEELFCALGEHIPAESAMRVFPAMRGNDLTQQIDDKKRRIIRYLVRKHIRMSATNKRRIVVSDDGLVSLTDYSFSRCVGIDREKYRENEWRGVLIVTARLCQIIPTTHARMSPLLRDGVLSFNVTKTVKHNYRAWLSHAIVEALNVTSRRYFDVIAIENGRVHCRPSLSNGNHQ